MARENIGSCTPGSCSVGEEHWHGATPDRFMTYLAMVEVDAEGNSATWGEHVSDDEYDPKA